MSNLKIITKPNSKHIAEAIKLDKEFFNESDSGTMDICLEWYNANNQIYLMLYDKKNKKVVGYINTLPITKSAYEAYKNNEIYDMAIKAKDIVKYQKNQNIYLLFTSIAILREYRSLKAKNMLLNALFKRFYNLSKKNIFVNQILFDCVTKVGEYFTRINSDSTLIWKNSKSSLYESNFTPSNMIDNIYKQKLIKAYDLSKMAKHN